MRWVCLGQSRALHRALVLSFRFQKIPNSLLESIVANAGPLAIGLLNARGQSGAPWGSRL